MGRLLRRYVNWLHTRWPAGTVEKLPEVREDGSTNVPGLYIVGDLTGIPLLKLSADTGSRAVQAIAGDRRFHADRLKTEDGVLDLLRHIAVDVGVDDKDSALADDEPAVID